MKSLLFVSLFIICLQSCNQNNKEEKKLFGIGEISMLKDYIYDLKCDSISWGLFNQLHPNLKIKSIDLRCDYLEFYAYDNKDKVLIHFKDKEFYIYNFIKKVNIENAIILIE